MNSRPSEEPRSCVHHAQRDVEAVLERLPDLDGLPFSQQAVVDEDALELRPDGPMQEQRDHRTVHAARKRADDALLADPLADLPGGLLRERAHLEVERDAAFLEEGLVELAAAGRVGDLGVELDRVELALGVSHRGVGGVVRPGERAEALGRSGHLVAVRHPDVEVLAGLQLAEWTRGLEHFQAGRPVLPVGGAVDLAAQELGHELQAIADAEHRNAQLEDLGVDHRRARLLDAVGAPGQDDPLRPEGADLVEGQVAGMDLTVDVQLADPPCDELGVLGAEVQNQDSFCMDVRHRASVRRRSLRARSPDHNPRIRTGSS